MEEKDKAGQKASITVPLTITFEIGGQPGTTAREGASVSIASTGTAPGTEYEILQKARQAFLGQPGVKEVRLGYQFQNGWITKQRAIVVTVDQRKSIKELAEAGMSAIPNRFMDYPVEISNPTLEQLLTQAAPEVIRALPAVNREAGRESRYFPPTGVQLKKVEEKMKVKVCVSPEEGWNNLKEFLAATQKSLTIAMYDFGAPHIVDTINGISANGNFEKFILTLQPGESVGEGTKKDDMTDKEVVDAFKERFGDKFDMSWVHIGAVNGWVNSSYHIKVAVRDHGATHVSSGNYQSSNEPNVAEMDDNPSQAFLLRTYNREWNAMIENKTIADMFEAFIIHDYKNNKQVGRETVAAVEDLYLLLPRQVAFTEAASNVKSFKPLDVDRNVIVTPLLTPDNYFEEVLNLIAKAEHELYIQNQTFNAPKENHDKLQQIVDAVLQKQQEGVDVKIIFRSIMASTARANLEALVEMGFDPQSIKTHSKVHTKGVVVDGKYVMIGSQNMSNDGVSVNRDASLLFEDEEIAQYYRTIFLHDWENVAKYNIGRESFNAKVVKGQPGAAGPNMEVVPMKDLLETL